MGTIPLPGDLLDLGIELGAPALQADSILSEPLMKPFEGDGYIYFLDGSDDLTSICICPNSSNCLH